MAGYAGFSKSNNAVEAEQEGKYPASILAKKLKVSTEAIKELLTPCEWHHTSNHYNRTDYYDMEDGLEILEKLKAYKTEKKELKKIENGKIEYIVWTGSRNFPKANQYIYNGDFEIKGEWLIFDGKRKKINSNGTKAFDSSGNRIFSTEK